MISMNEFQELLKKAIPDLDESVTIDNETDFKGLGLDSIAMLELIVSLSDFNLTLDENKIFEAVSVEQLFNAIIPE
jgi:acyl carrier protein